MSLDNPSFNVFRNAFDGSLAESAGGIASPRASLADTYASPRMRTVRRPPPVSTQVLGSFFPVARASLIEAGVQLQ